VGFSVIEFESVSKTFPGGTHAVQDLSLTIPSDRITVIVGPSGCGKTTTLRMVNRMLEPSKGRITWDGTPLRSRRKTALRRQMGYVIQSGGLFPHRTVLENIGTVPGLLGWGKDKTRKRSLELLGNVGLDRRMADRYPAQLSGGQQQRVGVARALAADPLVMLMDEPFSAVDPVVRAELHEFFLGLQRQISKTIVLITHDIEEAIKLGDQVVILRVGGRLAQAGPPQELLDEPADAFVEGFVGRDRGYRSLSFLPATGLSLGEVAVVREAAPGGDGGPTLVLDGDARPVGWVDEDKPGLVHPIGSTFVRDSDNLRAALDSALTSPYAIAVAIDGETGRYTGVATADEILDQVRRRREGVGPESVTVEAAEAREHELAAGSAVADATDAEPGTSAGPVPEAYDDAQADASEPAAEATEDAGATEDAAGSGTGADATAEAELAPGGATATGLDEPGRSDLTRDEPGEPEPAGGTASADRTTDGAEQPPPPVEDWQGGGAESVEHVPADQQVDGQPGDPSPLAEDEQPTAVRPAYQAEDEPVTDEGTSPGGSERQAGPDAPAAGPGPESGPEQDGPPSRPSSVRYWTPRTLPRDPGDRG
jgi:osmoprotectant transport system ATP-binding protein